MEGEPMEYGKTDVIKNELSTPKNELNTPRKKCKKTPKVASYSNEVVTSDENQKFRGAHRKWRKRAKRLNQSQRNLLKDSCPSSFSLFGCEVQYKVCGTIVLFKTEQVVIAWRKYFA